MKTNNQRKINKGRMGKSLFVALMVLVLTFGAVMSLGAQSKTSTSKAPDVTLEMLDGSEVTLSNLNDKPVLLNFWATWCGYCVKEFPDLEEVWQEYGDDIHIIAINVGEGKSAIEGFLKKSTYTFPIAMDTKYLASTAYQVSGIPVTIIINTDGTIAFSRVGMMSKTAMVRAVETVLK